MKKNRIKSVFLIVAVAIFGIIGFSSNVFAEGHKAFLVSPMNQRIILIPGETYQGSLKVGNPASSTEDFSYIAEVSSYHPMKVEGDEDDYGGANYTDRTNANMIVDWITIENPTGILSPNEECTVLFTIEVPDTAPAGGQYAAILVREDVKANVRENSESIIEIMQMAHVIYADVTGEAVKAGEILENSIPSFLFNNELKTVSRFKNTGNVHTDAEIALQVWPIFSDEEICTNEENVSTSLVVPDTERYHAEVCNLPMLGIFRAKQTVRIFGEESIVEKTIIVCPLWLMFVIIFVIVLIVVWLFTRSKARKGSKKAKTAE